MDADHEVARAYGVWKGATLLGMSAGLVQRSTFIIDEEGVVVEAWRGVSARGHAEKVRKALEALDGQG